MRDEPPHELLQLLQRLNLATEAQVRGVVRRARRLAEGVPLFESVWVDALAQARVLTAFQAAEINAGRGASLKIGPYLLCQRLPALGYAECYQARLTRSEKLVRLTIVSPEDDRVESVLSQLQTLATQAGNLAHESIAPITAAGIDGGRVWAAGPFTQGTSIAEWVVHNGRLPPEAVLEIARQMLTGLVILEKAGVAHGDLGVANLSISSDGRVTLPQPGLRAILRPAEGYAHADLNPECFDYLPPERVSEGTPCGTAGDIYSAGAVWWHLLAGRPPISGGSSLAKLQAIATARIVEVRRLAPETPSSLAAAVTACLQRQPRMRPESMLRLSASLGLPTHSGRHLLAECLVHPGRRRKRWAASIPALRDSGRAPIWIAATAGCLIAAITLTWSSRQPGPTIPPASIPAPPAADPPPTTERVRRPSVIPRVAGRKPIDEPRGERVLSEVRDGENPDLPSRKSEPSPDMILSDGRPLAVESLPLQPGQCVRGEGEKRPLLVVPVTGLVVAVEGVRFQNIDFLWNAVDRVPASVGPPAIIHLHVSRAEFRGCSFQASATAPQRPTAIRWTQRVDRGRIDLALPSGQVQLADCVFRRVSAAVSCQRVGALSLQAANVLHLGPGPLVQLDHCPQFDEPIFLQLGAVTLREAGSLLECAGRLGNEQPGKIVLQADGCVLAPSPGVAVLGLVGESSPDKFLASIEWTGQDSLVTPETPIAQWRRPNAAAETLDEAAVAVSGLVRSAVAFSGPAEAGPSASRTSRWQAPLRSSQPPGVDPGRLVWPER